MITQTLVDSRWKLVIFSEKLVADNKKVGDQWIPTGTQSKMYSYTFVDATFKEEIKISSKSDEWGKFLNQEVILQFKVEQFGVKSPSCKLYAVLPLKK